MGALSAGDVVLLTFPFSDLSQSKVRPAADVLAALATMFSRKVSDESTL